ncbi:hypothetical protein [Streptomyces anulatus]|uniref:hypothetical protein n=1 Tax=Streptomyces anulatus TaxID=1892 RepID=UPI0007099827|nr:hypothetical protein [Streptomyces anulatus]
MHMDAERLARSSQKWMAAAFSAFSDGPLTEDMAVHHAGVATEHLLKAFLVNLHPALIADGRDFNSLLYAAGHGPLLQVRADQVKTIQLGEAYDRAQKILKGKIPPKPRGPWPLADARNGVAHCGYHDPGAVNAVFTSALKVIDPLLEELAIGPDYWGTYKELHDHLVAVQVEEESLFVQGKLVKARRTFAARYAHLSERDRLLVLAAVSNSVPAGYIEHDEKAACPACASQGWLSGETWAEAATVMFYPVEFNCPACDLRLLFDELDMATEGFGSDRDLEVEPGDFYPDWEPDEDDQPLGEDEPGLEPDEDAMVDAYRNR